MKLRNPRLYDALIDAFNHVQVLDPGMPVAVGIDGGKRFPSFGRSERFRTVCPFCGQPQLYVSYFWRAVDPRTGDPFPNLVVCTSDNCIDTPEVESEIENLVHGSSWRQVDSRIMAFQGFDQTRVRSRPRLTDRWPVAWPRCSADVRDQVEQWGLNPEELWARWTIMCEEPRWFRSVFQDEICAPVYRFQRRLGDPTEATILARWVGCEIDGNTAEFDMGTGQSRLVYGLVEATATTGPIVVCESILNVWRLGTNAVAPLGDGFSPRQQELVIRRFRSRPLVVLGRNAVWVHETVEALKSGSENAGAAAPVTELIFPEIDATTTAKRAAAWAAVARSLGVSMGDLGNHVRDCIEGRHPDASDRVVGGIRYADEPTRLVNGQ